MPPITTKPNVGLNVQPPFSTNPVTTNISVSSSPARPIHSSNFSPPQSNKDGISGNGNSNASMNISAIIDSNPDNGNSAINTNGGTTDANIINPDNSAAINPNNGSLSTTPKKLLSTSSPEGIQVASKITPTRLANLLIRKGPLPIRHITGHLAVEVPSFDQLSLSKQRRLIMAAMEQTDPSNNVVFEKIGWGQWAVRKVDSDFIVTEGTESTGGEVAGKTAAEIKNMTAEDRKQPLLNVNDLRNQTNLKLGWSKKQNVLQNSQNHLAKKGRRESITNNVKNLHNLKLPNEPAASTAIASDSEDDEYDHLSDNMEQDNEDTPESSSESEEEDDNVMFSFDQDQDESANNTNRFKRSPPIKFAKRVPIKVSPPPLDAVLSTSASRNRRKSSSSNPASSFISKPSTYRHQLFNRSRLNSLDNLDNYLISSAKNSQVSINSPPPISSFQSPPNMGTSPINSWNSNYIHATSNDEFIINNANNVNAQNGHRKSSFNESHIRSTLSSSLPMGASLYPHSTPALQGDAQHIQQTQQSNHHQPQHNTGPYDNLAYANSTPSVLHSSNGNASDTDEEDWATIGAESLRKHHLAVSGLRKKNVPRKHQHPSHHQRHQPAAIPLAHSGLNGGVRSRSRSRTRPSIDASSAGELNDEEKSAAFALVDLMSV